MAGDVTKQPIYWFAILERARQQGNFDEAARAQQELANLGVSVKYGTLRAAKKVAGAAMSIDAEGRCEK